MTDSASPLRRLLLREARRARIWDHTPTALLEHRRAWYVESGTVDMFWVPLEDGQPSGPHRHLARFSSGQVFFGVPPASRGHAIGLYAMVDADAKVRWLEVSRLGELARGGDFHDEVTSLVDHWVTVLYQALGCPPAPSDATRLRVGTTLRLEGGGVVRATGDVAWIPWSDALRVHGLYRVVGPRALLFPVGTRGWLVSDEPVDEPARSTSESLELDHTLAALDALHGTVAGALLERARSEELAERERLAVKRASEQRRLQETLAALVDVADARPSRAEHRDPLAAALLELARTLGVEQPPPLAPLAGPRPDRIRHLTRALRLRTRRVLLEPGWWRRDNGPLLAFHAADERPVALIPKGRRRRYELYDPQERRTSLVSRVQAEQLQPHGYCFHRTLPGRALTRRDLLAFAFFDVRRDLTTALLLGVFVGLLGTLFPLATGWIFDAIIPGADRSLLLQVVLVLVGLTVGSTVLGVVRSISMLRMETKMGTDVQAATWDRLIGLPVDFFRGYTAGDLAERATGIDRIHRALSGSVISSVFSAIFAAWYLLLLFYYDLRLALLATALVLVPMALGVTSSLLQLRYQRRLAGVRGRLTGLLLQIFGGITKLRVAGLEQEGFHLWARDFRALRALRRRSTIIDIWVKGARSAYSGLSTALLFYVVANSDTALTTGQFVAFFAAFTIFGGALLRLLDNGLVLVSTIPLWERARPILEAEVEADPTKEHPGRLTGEIEVAQLSFRYTPDQPMVLNQVSFRVRAGEFVAVVGPSGCGKSTLLRLLLGFEKPVTGTVFYSGQPLSSLDVAEVRRQLGVVLQDSRVLSGSIRDNICGAREHGDAEVWQALRRAGLAEDVEAMPMRLHTVISHGGTNLSGGQRQRLMIARAIISEPKVLLFDEATSALDNHTQSIVAQSLEDLQVTRIVIAHRLSTIQHVDRIFVMDRGRIVDEGRYEELIARAGPFRELAHRQLA